MLQSCPGKLFTLIINKRLKYTEMYDIIRQNKAGFYKDHSAVDTSFIIQSLVNLSYSDAQLHLGGF